MAKNVNDLTPSKVALT